MRRMFGGKVFIFLFVLPLGGVRLLRVQQGVYTQVCERDYLFVCFPPQVTEGHVVVLMSSAQICSLISKKTPEKSLSVWKRSRPELEETDGEKSERVRVERRGFRSEFCSPVDHFSSPYRVYTYVPPLSLHHRPLAVCSSHFHLTSTFCSISPSVFRCRRSASSRRRKRPPVVCSLGDNTSLSVSL